MVKWNKNTVRFYLLLVPISDCQTNCWCVRVRGFQSICCIFLKIRRPQISRLIINCRLLVFMFLFAFDSFVEIPINNTVYIIIHRCFLLLTYKAGYSPSTSLAGPLARNGSGPVSRNGSGPLGPLSRSNSLCGHPSGQGDVVRGISTDTWQHLLQPTQPCQFVENDCMVPCMVPLLKHLLMGWPCLDERIPLGRESQGTVPA